MHCGVAYESVRSLARGHVIRGCQRAVPWNLKPHLQPAVCCSDALLHLNLGDTPELIIVNLIPRLEARGKLQALILYTCNQEMFTC